MLPLVSNDAVAILFMFDLTRKSTLNSIKEWYRQARGFNKVSCLILRRETQGCQLIPCMTGMLVDGHPGSDWDQV